MNIQEIIDLLESDANYFINEVLLTDEWKLYKFGRGGKYNQLLFSLTKKSQLYDKEIYNYFITNKEKHLKDNSEALQANFKAGKENAYFATLIRIGVQTNTPKDRFIECSKLLRQINHMQESLRGF